MRWTKANLNFPLDFGISPEDSTKTKTDIVGRKRTKDVSDAEAKDNGWLRFAGEGKEPDMWMLKIMF
ncbi:hypothetical protein Hanom_Chr11g01034351 [Helianthus anomalus]